ncbi:Transposase DDE domain-containing protein [Desulfonema magnum]|uniref:Transposase DDE domain-containing protein n=1 Tax=Desulfonema magnum TaxID=45655 RepID=A0A975BW95_9BACT|nr:Transposase DDE domain-containing protein [Desulfonema magnum]
MRISMDCKATAKIGEYSRGGKTRGDNSAADHDMGRREKHTPFGMANEDDGRLHMILGSSARTGDFITDSLYE